jgi:tRNA U38,U39,U40 pseudouridine synthase TruA
LKLLIEGDETLLDRINRELPPDVRLLGSARVVNGFDARRNCDRRRYEYILPACAFDPLAFRDRTSVALAAEAGAHVKRCPLLFFR